MSQIQAKPEQIITMTEQREIKLALDYDFDPSMKKGYALNESMKVVWDDDRSFAIEANGWSLHIGNCSHCFSGGPIHDHCRHCHTKERPSYYSILRMREKVMHPFHLAHCAMKPMDIPETPKELQHFSCARPEEEFLGTGVPIVNISLALYHIRVPHTLDMPLEIKTHASNLPTSEKNRIHREGCVIPDDKSCYYDVIQVRSQFDNFFQLNRTTLQNMQMEHGSIV